MPHVQAGGGVTVRRFAARVAFTTILSAGVYALWLVHVTPYNGLFVVTAHERTRLLLVMADVVLAVIAFLAAFACACGLAVGMRGLYRAGWR
jgi:hypothetical protein